MAHSHCPQIEPIPTLTAWNHLVGKVWGLAVTVFHRQARTSGGKLIVEKEELKHKDPTHVPKSLAYREGYLP